MSVTTAVLLVVALLLAGVYLSWTAGRLDRLHARVDAAWAALDAQLARRAAAARALVPLLPPEQGEELARAAQASLDAGDTGREAVENDLTRSLRSVLSALPPDAELHELESAVTKVGLARSFHNAAVEDTRALRRRRVPRLFRLAGRRELPQFFEIDDTSLLPRQGGRRT
ncbi:MAG: hypothetical protein ACLGIG_09575 [Actinomycetes bacterium]